MVKSGKIEKLWQGGIFCHQSSICRAELLKTVGFDAHDGVAADFGFFYRIYKSGVVFLQVDDCTNMNLKRL